MRRTNEKVQRKENTVGGEPNKHKIKSNNTLKEYICMKKQYKKKILLLQAAPEVQRTYEEKYRKVDVKSFGVSEKEWAWKFQLPVIKMA